MQKPPCIKIWQITYHTKIKLKLLFFTTKRNLHFIFYIPIQTRININIAKKLVLVITKIFSKLLFFFNHDDSQYLGNSLTRSHVDFITNTQSNSNFWSYLTNIASRKHRSERKQTAFRTKFNEPRITSRETIFKKYFIYYKIY